MKPPSFIEFVVPGIPTVKSRPRFGKHGNVYTPRKTTAFERTISVCWLVAAAPIRWRPCDGPCAVTIRLFYPDARPRDVDNGAKAVLDGLNGLTFVDDRLVVELHAYKFIDRERPRVEIRVDRLQERRGSDMRVEYVKVEPSQEVI